MVLHQPWVGGDLVASHGDHRHGLGAARDDDFGATHLNALGRHGDGLQARRAEAIDGHGRDLLGQSGAQGCDTGDVHALFRFWHGAAEDDVFDIVQVELGHAVERALMATAASSSGRVARRVPL